MYRSFLLLLFLACSNTPELPQRGICAHRGANNTHPENTIAAFKEAIRLGVHMIEFDVQVSKDGQLIIMHDKTVDRTTDGVGAVSDLSLDELKKLDAGSWKSAIYKNERVPTLQETLEIMPTNIWLNIHIKGEAEVGQAVAQVIVGNRRIDQAIVACKTKAAEAALKVDNRIKICNMERRENSITYVDETIAMQADFIQLKERADPFLPELAQKLRQNGIRINYYGTNSPNKLKQLYAAGIQFPLVDDVSEMMKIANELGIHPVTTKYEAKNN